MPDGLGVFQGSPQERRLLDHMTDGTGLLGRTICSARRGAYRVSSDCSLTTPAGRERRVRLLGFPPTARDDPTKQRWQHLTELLQQHHRAIDLLQKFPLEGLLLAG